MYPWGHLAVGYLCYSLGVRLCDQRPPAGVAMVPLTIGTQFPDLCGGSVRDPHQEERRCDHEPETDAFRASTGVSSE